MDNSDRRPARPLWRTRRAQLALAVGALLAAATGASAAVHATGPASADAVKPVLKLHKTSIGTILVDRRGRTLYMFAPDKKSRSVCYGQCAIDWPPLYVPAKGKLRVQKGVKASLVGRTKRKDGRFQLTYKQHPLYLFKFDTKAGQLNGQDYLGDGGKWWVVSPTGRVIKKRVEAAEASTTTTTTTTSGGGGGGGYGGGEGGGDVGGGGAAWG
jgi:predicted lipoprotein with Yx(FWY)xxD motif